MHNKQFELLPVSRLCDLMNGYAFKPGDWSEYGTAIIRIQNLNGSKEYNYFRGLISDRYLVEPETLLFSWSGNRGTSFGPYIWIGPRGLLNQHIFKVTPKAGINRKWLFYALHVAQEKAENQAHGGSGLVHVRRGELLSYTIPTPGPEEQNRIAEILATKDEAIQKTEALIEKLKAMKQGLLHDLLTRGLDENGKLRDPKAHPEQFKDSPLGRVPNAWDIERCKDVCSEIVVGIVIRPAQYYRPTGVPVLRSANIKEDGLVPSDLVYMSAEANKSLSKSQIHEGDVLTVRTGYPGTSCAVPPEFNGANCVDLLISRPREGILSGYLNIWINSDLGKTQVLRKQGGLAQQHFNVGELKKLLIAKPGFVEQQRIVDISEAHSARIKAEQQYLDKLKLQKKGLIHDLLTGKVRVKADTPVENVPS